MLGTVKARPGGVGEVLLSGATAGLDSLLRAAASEICGRGGRKPAARSNKRKHQKESAFDRYAAWYSERWVFVEQIELLARIVVGFGPEGGVVT